MGAGLIRDVLIREEPMIFKPGQFYAGAAIAGCIIFVSLVFVWEIDDGYAAMIAIVFTFFLRILSILFDWRTKAILRNEPD